jgi:hypothetical protein
LHYWTLFDLIRLYFYIIAQHAIFSLASTYARGNTVRCQASDNSTQEGYQRHK